jgi:hypothetical protein
MNQANFPPILKLEDMGVGDQITFHPQSTRPKLTTATKFLVCVIYPSGSIVLEAIDGTKKGFRSQFRLKRDGKTETGFCFMRLGSNKSIYCECQYPNLKQVRIGPRSAYSYCIRCQKERKK